MLLEHERKELDEMNIGKIIINSQNYKTYAYLISYLLVLFKYPSTIS